MFGNLLRECGVLGNLSDTAQNVLANLVTLLLGITISFSMRAEEFVQLQTLGIMVIGLVAFIFDTAAGVIFAKIINLFSKEKNQSYDWCGRNFCIPYVCPCSTKTCT